MTRVLLVVEDPGLLGALCVSLHAQGFEVAVGAGAAEDPGRVTRQVADLRPDLAVLDLGIAGLDGRQVISGLRGWTQMPIIALSGEDTNREQVAALDAGADHFVTRPFTVEELIAHVRAILRRITIPRTDPTVRIGGYLVDLDAKTIRATDRDDIGTAPRLTPTEWRLLEILLRNPGKLITRQELLTQIAPDAHAHSESYLRQYMVQLRRKLEPEPATPRYLITRAGAGYQFRPGRQGSKR